MADKSADAVGNVGLAFAYFSWYTDAFLPLLPNAVFVAVFRMEIQRLFLGRAMVHNFKLFRVNFSLFGFKKKEKQKFSLTENEL